MRYIEDPSDFYKVNHLELFAFGRWCLNRRNMMVNDEQLTEIMHTWYEKRIHNLLKNYNEKRGKIENYIRLSFEQWLGRFYYSLFRSKLITQELTGELEEMIPDRDASIEESDFWIDFPHLMHYLREGHNVTEKNLFVKVLELTVAETSLEGIAKKLKITNIQVCTIQGKIRQKIHAFYRKTALF